MAVDNSCEEKIRFIVKYRGNVSEIQIQIIPRQKNIIYIYIYIYFGEGG